MRLAMAQMAMTDNIDEDADRALAYYDQAGITPDFLRTFGFRV